MDAWAYMLRCSDGSYYVGSHRGPDPGVRVAEHQAGEGGDYTARRRPVALVWVGDFIWITDAIAYERRVKGWSRAKKEALIKGDWEAVRRASKRRGGRVRPSRPADAGASG